MGWNICIVFTVRVKFTAGLFHSWTKRMVCKGNNHCETYQNFTLLFTHIDKFLLSSHSPNNISPKLFNSFFHCFSFGYLFDHVKMRDDVKIAQSFPDKLGILSFNEEGEVIGINQNHDFVVGRSKQELGGLICNMIGIFDFDMTRNGTTDREAQVRLGELVNDLLTT